MISKIEIYNEVIYEQVYNYMKSKPVARKKENLIDKMIQNIKNKSLILYKVKQGFILIGGLTCITLHIVLLLLKLM
jgi:hypothetical protein